MRPLCKHQPDFEVSKASHFESEEKSFRTFYAVQLFLDLVPDWQNNAWGTVCCFDFIKNSNIASQEKDQNSKSCHVIDRSRFFCARWP